MRLAAIILAVALALAGCGEERQDTTSDGRPTVPGPSDSLVVYERGGGIAGVRDGLEVRPDGAARVSAGGKSAQVQLSPPELDGLRAAVDGVRDVKLDPLYGSDPPPDDAFETTVLVDSRRVRVVSGGDPPPELERLLSVCAELVRRHAPR